MAVRIIAEKCKGCQKCLKNCPFDAIEKIDDGNKGVDITLYHDVWVFAEQRENKGDNLGRKLAAVNVVAEEQDVAHTLVVNAVENAEEIDEIAVEIADNVNWRPFSDEHWHRHESSRCLVRELDDDLRRKEGN